MSGGSYDYAFRHLSDLAEQIDSKTRERNKKHSVERLNFAELLRLCSTAAHAIEWCDSGDWGDAQMLESIAACFEFTKTTKLPTTASSDPREDSVALAAWAEFNKIAEPMGPNYTQVLKHALLLVSLYRRMERKK